MDKKLFTNGNRKIGKDTLIFNMNSASDCPSEKLGLCALADKCYAKKAEKQYPAVLPFRRRQEKAWESTTTVEFVETFMAVVKSKKKNPIKYFRFSESGDFKSQGDVTKMSIIARLLNEQGITTYGYTARNDLVLTELQKYATVQGSGFMGSNEFRPVMEFTGKNPQCNGSDCSKCTLCKVGRRSTIEVLVH